MKAELEVERRKSTVDQAKLRKVEALIAEKERRLEQAEEEFLRRDSDIRELEKAIDEERRKSMADVQKLKKLEEGLAQKIEEAGRYYQGIVEAQEKYELSAEEMNRLRQEMERERRTTMAEN